MSAQDFYGQLEELYGPGTILSGEIRFEPCDDGFRVGVMIFSDEEDLVTLELIMVDGGLQGRGIGRSMLENICKAADETGTDIALSVVIGPRFDEVRLTAWYQASGFEVRPELCFGDDKVFVREARPDLEPAF